MKFRVDFTPVSKAVMILGGLQCVPTFSIDIGCFWAKRMSLDHFVNAKIQLIYVDATPLPSKF